MKTDNLMLQRFFFAIFPGGLRTFLVRGLRTFLVRRFPVAVILFTTAKEVSTWAWSTFAWLGGLAFAGIVVVAFVDATQHVRLTRRRYEPDYTAEGLYDKGNPS